MKKYLVGCLLCVSLTMMGMQVEVKQLSTQDKKRESVSRVLKNSRPILRASSGEFLIRHQDISSAAVIFRLSDSSLSDQGCSPGDRFSLDRS